MALGRKRNEEKPLDCGKKRRPLPKVITQAGNDIGGRQRHQEVNAWAPEMIPARNPRATGTSAQSAIAGAAKGRLTAAAKVGFDQKPRIVVESRSINLHVLDDALNVVARLRN